MQHHLPLRSKIIIMVSVMASLFLVALDQTIIATALGKIVEEFSAFSSLSWVVTAYLLTTTITIPIAGKMSDLYGRRTVLLIGVAVFTIGSMLSGLSGNIEQLVVWRAVQGIGGGIITANAFTIVADLFVARERGRWQGMIGAVFGLSSIVGPLLGGWLTDGHTIAGLTTDWRWTFYINIPVGILAFALLVKYCPSLRRDAKPRIDYLGVAILASILALTVLAIDNTEEIFSTLLTNTGMSLAVLRILMTIVIMGLIVWFVVVERRANEPVIPLRFFKNRNFVLIIFISLLFGASFIGSILYLTQFNQQVFGATPTESGLMLLPLVAGVMLSSVGAGQIISRIGRYKWFMRIGLAVAAVFMASLATLSPESTYAQEAVLMVCLGLGMGVALPVLNLAVQNEFAMHDVGVATSSTQLFRSLGSTIGVSVFGALLTAGIVAQIATVSSTQYVQQIARTLPASMEFDAQDSNTLLRLNTTEMKRQAFDMFTKSLQTTPPDARRQAESMFLVSQREFSSTIVGVFSDSLRRVYIIASIVIAVAAMLSWWIKERTLAGSSKP